MLRSFSTAMAVVLAAPVHSYGHTDEVPIANVRFAYTFYRLLGSKPRPVLAENQLRIFALNKADPVLNGNLAWVRQSNWQPEFKAIFERVVRWTRTTRRKSPGELYRLSHELQKRPDAKENHFDSLFYRLLQMAAKMGNLNAIAELTQRVHPADEPKARAKSARNKYKYATAKKGRYSDGLIAGAQTNLAYSYWKGLGVEKDLMKALYWFLRGNAKRSGRILGHFPHIEHAFNLSDDASQGVARRHFRDYQPGTAHGTAAEMNQMPVADHAIGGGIHA